MKNCEWLDEQPAFLKDVEIDGEKIATIHALTKLDMGEIRRKADTRSSIDKKGDMYLYTNPEKLEVAKIYQSLVGNKKAGWELNREVTEANINVLPKKYYTAILDAILELENQNEVDEELEGN